MLLPSIQSLLTISKAGTFISREAYISIDSNDDVIALHSYSDFQSDISVCHVVKVNKRIEIMEFSNNRVPFPQVSSNMERVVWDSVIETIDGDSSCMPTGLGSIPEY